MDAAPNPWNPREQARLLWQLFMQPERFTEAAFQDPNRVKKTGGWLIATLCWPLLAVPLLSIGLDLVENTGEDINLSVWLWLLAALAAWVVTGWLGRSNNSLVSIAALIIALALGVGTGRAIGVATVYGDTGIGLYALASALVTGTALALASNFLLTVSGGLIALAVMIGTAVVNPPGAIVQLLGSVVALYAVIAILKRSTKNDSATLLSRGALVVLGVAYVVVVLLFIGGLVSAG